MKLLIIAMLMAPISVFAKSQCAEYVFKDTPDPATWQQRTYDYHKRFVDWLPNWRKGSQSSFKLNLELESTPMTIEQMVAKGYISQIGKSIPGFNTHMTMRLKKIGVDLIIPREDFVEGKHINPMIVIPGSGTDRSTPISLLPIVATMNKVNVKKKDMKPALGDKWNDSKNALELGYRAWTITYGIPGNFGTRTRKHQEFLESAQGQIIVARHIHLIMQNYMSNKFGVNPPFVITGRSYGGLIAAAYAHQYAGVIAIGISSQPGDLQNIIATAERHFEGGVATKGLVVGGKPVNIDHRSMYNAETQSHRFDFSGQSQSPILLVQSRHDISYDMNLLPVWLSRFVKGDPENRHVIWVPEALKADHDLWRKPHSKQDRVRARNNIIKDLERNNIDEAIIKQKVDEFEREQDYLGNIFNWTLETMATFIRTNSQIMKQEELF